MNRDRNPKQKAPFAIGLVVWALLLVSHLCAGAIAVPIITAGGATTFCEGASVVLTASPTGGGGYAGGTTYQWMKDASNISGATSTTYTATTSGSYTVKVVNGADNATSAATTVTVTAKVPFAISAPDLGVCPDKELVTWHLPIKCTISGNGITSTGGWNWEIGAESVQQITGNGYMEHTIDNSTATRFIGLSTTNNLPSYTSIQYAIRFDGGGYVSIHENGTSRGTFAQFTAGKKIRIAVEDGVVRYYYDGQWLYNSTVPPTGALVVDAAMYAPGTYFSNATIQRSNVGGAIAFTANPSTGGTYQWKVNGWATSTTTNTFNKAGLVPGDKVSAVFTPSTACVSSTTDTKTIVASPPTPNPVSITASTLEVCVRPEPVVWQSPVNCDLVGTGLLGKGSNNWDASAKSIQEITGNGYVEYTIESTTSNKRIGLSPSNYTTSTISSKYCLYLDGTGKLWTIEDGNNPVYVGTYQAGKKVRVAVNNGVVKYYYDNTALATAASTATGPLSAQVFLFGNGNAFVGATVQRSNTSPAISFTANGPAGTYQWKVNGTVEGSNSGTFSRAALLPGDVVQVNLTPTDNCLANSTDSKTIISSTPTAPPFSITASTFQVCPAPEPVIWQHTKQARNVSNNYMASNTEYWDAGGSSAQKITGNGYMEYILPPLSTAGMIVGLTSNNQNPSYESIQYGFYLQTTGYIIAIESGITKGNAFPYVANSTIRIAVQENTVKYYNGSALVWTSQIPVTSPLLVGVSFGGFFASVNNIKIQRSNTGTPITFSTNLTGGTYQWTVNGQAVGDATGTLVKSDLLGGDVVKVVFNPTDGCYSVSNDTKTITSTSLLPPSVTLSSNVSAICPAPELVKWQNVKNMTLDANGQQIKAVNSTNWNAGAESIQRITGDGYIEFGAFAVQFEKIVGLSTSNNDTRKESVQYGFYISKDGTETYNTNGYIYVSELGVPKGNRFRYTGGDPTLKIAVEGGVVRYYYGTNLVYISTTPPSGPLVVDMSINGGSMYNNSSSAVSFGTVSIQQSNVTPVTLTGSATSGTYQWSINNRIVGNSTNTFSTTGLAGNDNVRAFFTSSNMCQATVMASKLIGSSSCTSSVATPAITSTTTNFTCTTSQITLSATVPGTTTYQNGETIQWLKDWQAIDGATTYTYNATKEGVYVLRVKKGETVVTSNPISLAVPPGGPLLISSQDQIKSTSDPVSLKVRSNFTYYTGIGDLGPLEITNIAQNVSNNFTIELWAHPLIDHEIDPESLYGSYGTGQNYVVFPANGSLMGTGHSTVGVSVGRNGVSVYEYADNYNPSVLVWEGTINGWNHIAVVYTNGTPSLYVNGQLKRTGIKSTKAFVHPTTFVPYSSNGLSYGYYHGFLDETRIWSVARSVADLQKYAKKIVAPEPSLILYKNEDLYNRISDPSQLTWAPTTALNNISGFEVSVNPSETTTYTVSYTDTYNCTYSNSITVTVTGSPTPTSTKPGPGGVGDAQTNKIWLDASALTGFSSGGKVGLLKDRSGNNMDFTQGSLNNQPLYVTNVLNGKPVIRFDRTTAYKYLENTSASIGTLLSGSNTIITLSKTTSGGVTNLATGKGQSIFVSTADRSGIYYSGSPTTTAVAAQTYDASLTGLGGETPITQGTWNLTSMATEETGQGTNVKSYYNGTQFASSVSANQLYNHTTTRIGVANTSGDYAWPLNGDIPEIIVYNKALNNAERIVVENYLAAKYALPYTNDFYTLHDPSYILDVQGIGTTDGTGAQKSAISTSVQGMAIAELNGSLNSANEFLMAGHNSTANTLVASDLSTPLVKRWQRIFYLEKSTGSSIDVKLSFDVEGLAVPSLSNYRLLYRTGTTGDFVLVTDGTSPILPTIDSEGQISFTLANGTISPAGLNSGYYTLGIINPEIQSYVVTTNETSGAGSLKEAILWANANPDLSTITFNIPYNLPILLDSELPPITYPVFINGATQPGYNPLDASTQVHISNSSSNQAPKGLLFIQNSNGSGIYGIRLNAFTMYGIRVQVEDVAVREVKVE